MLDVGAPNIDQCPCPESPMSASHIVKIAIHDDGDHGNDEEQRFTCYRTAEWPRLFNGVIDVDLVPIRRGNEIRKITFGFPREAGKIIRVYLICCDEAVEEFSSNTFRNRAPERPGAIGAGSRDAFGASPARAPSQH